MITFKYKLVAAILFLLSATTMNTCFASSPRRPAPKKEKTSKPKKKEEPPKVPAAFGKGGTRVDDDNPHVVSPQKKPECCIM